MGAIGSDAAIETADIALMTDDISRLPWLVHHAKRTLAIIRQNIAFSLVSRQSSWRSLSPAWPPCGAPSPNVGASLVVITNALRLLHPARVPDTGSRA
jgi:Zn2+/Cd2+-exporting ATPase